MYFGQVNVEEMRSGSVYGIMERAGVACFDDLLVLCFMVDVGLWLRGFSEGNNSSHESPLADSPASCPIVP